jgi:hypothetical protein
MRFGRCPTVLKGLMITLTPADSLSPSRNSSKRRERSFASAREEGTSQPVHNWSAFTNGGTRSRLYARYLERFEGVVVIIPLRTVRQAPTQSSIKGCEKTLTLSQPNSPYGLIGRLCFCTPFYGAFAWSGACFAWCTTVLKGLTLSQPNSPYGLIGRLCFCTPFDGAFAWSGAREKGLTPIVSRVIQPSSKGYDTVTGAVSGLGGGYLSRRLATFVLAHRRLPSSSNGVAVKKDFTNQYNPPSPTMNTGAARPLSDSSIIRRIRTASPMKKMKAIRPP